MNFTQFVGNEKVKTELGFLLQSGRLPHAIVIEGDEGMGKRTLARDITVNLLCRQSKNDACTTCPQCKKVMGGIHPDVYEYSATGGARSFKVDTVRDIIKDCYMQPNEAEYKVYILGNCHLMGEPAQNAILKILEEPPSYAIFILTVNTKSALLETVLSRSVVIALDAVDAKTGADYIYDKCDDVSFDDAHSAITVWGGNIGKAMQSLGDGKLSKISNITNDICNAMVKDNEYALIKACSVFERDRETLISVLSLLKTVFRDAMLLGFAGDIISGQTDAVRMLNRELSKDKLLRLITVCDDVRTLAVKNGNNAILITKICYELRRALGR